MSGASAARKRRVGRDRLAPYGPLRLRRLGVDYRPGFGGCGIARTFPAHRFPVALIEPRSFRPGAKIRQGFDDASDETGWTGRALCGMRAGRRRRRARLLLLVLPVLLLGGVRRVEQRPLLPAARGKHHPGQGERETQHPPASGTSRTPGGGRRRGERGSTHAPSIDGRRGVAIHRRWTCSHSRQARKRSSNRHDRTLRRQERPRNPDDTTLFGTLAGIAGGLEPPRTPGMRAGPAMLDLRLGNRRHVPIRTLGRQTRAFGPDPPDTVMRGTSGELRIQLEASLGARRMRLEPDPGRHR